MISVRLAAVLPWLQSPPALAPSHPPIGMSSYVTQRGCCTRRKALSDFEPVLADLARADAVFVGEQHDDSSTHHLELALVEGLTRRGTPVIVAMEMFERDVQPVIERYVSGAINEEQFLKDSRPWPRYATDYRPLLVFARAHKLPIVASNVPRRIASDVSKKGMSVIEGLSAADRAFAAKELSCPASGSYYDRFNEAMGGHEGSNSNFYFAQCVKDETMGETVATAFNNASDRVTIVHINGAFHTDFTEGTAASARRRMPGRRIAVVSMLPVDDLDTEKPDDDDLKRADYLVFTITSKQ